MTKLIADTAAWPMQRLIRRHRHEIQKRIVDNTARFTPADCEPQAVAAG